MRLTPLEKKLNDMSAPVIEDLGFALVQVKHLSDNGGTVQVMAEDPATGRLGVDDAAKISRALSAVFDVEDPINGAYRLEVSSPGIDRPLTRLADFEKYKDFEVKLESDIPNENGQRKFRGFIVGVKGEMIQIKADQDNFEIPFGALTKAKLVLTDDLIKRTANL